MKVNEEAKKIIERNPLLIGSSTLNGKPNITIVDYAKVLNNREVIFRNVEMTTCAENLISNPEVCIVAFDHKKKIGYKMFGRVRFEREGSAFEEAAKDVASRGRQLKGLFVAESSKIFRFK